MHAMLRNTQSHYLGCSTRVLDVVVPYYCMLIIDLYVHAKSCDMAGQFLYDYGCL